MEKFIKMHTYPAGRRWVVGDIHGCLATFRALVEDKISLNHSDWLFLLGDYIDRGQNSSGVLDYIIELRAKGYQIFSLRGNHEENLLHAEQEYNDRMLKLFVAKLNKAPDLLGENGRVIPKYIDFIQRLPYCYELPEFYLVHAGFRFSHPTPLEDWVGMVEVRSFEPDESILQGKKIVRGHKPHEFGQIQVAIAQKATVLPLDNGCVYNKPHRVYNYEQLGNLCALHLDTYELIWQKNIEI